MMSFETDLDGALEYSFDTNTTRLSCYWIMLHGNGATGLIELTSVVRYHPVILARDLDCFNA